MNAIVFRREKGERSEVYYLLGKYFYQGILFICSHITFPMIYSFYFLCFGFRRNEYNNLEGIKGGEVRSLLLVRKVYHPKEKDDILPQYSSEFIVYNDSWRYHLISMTALRRQYQNKPQPSVPFPISLPKTISIHYFWSQNTEKRNTAISQMRLGSVFRMRMSILNTATTEQMGYGSISFFVCFL